MTLESTGKTVLWAFVVSIVIFLYTVVVPSLINSQNDISVLFGIILIKVGIIGIIVGTSEYFYSQPERQP